jgi:hypothetical protein
MPPLSMNDNTALDRIGPAKVQWAKGSAPMMTLIQLWR